MATQFDSHIRKRLVGLFEPRTGHSVGTLIHSPARCWPRKSSDVGVSQVRDIDLYSQPDFSYAGAVHVEASTRVITLIHCFSSSMDI